MPALFRMSGKKPPPPSHSQMVTLLLLGNGERMLQLVQGLRSFPQRQVAPPSLQANPNVGLPAGQTLPILKTVHVPQRRQGADEGQPAGLRANRPTPVLPGTRSSRSSCSPTSYPTLYASHAACFTSPTCWGPCRGQGPDDACLPTS